jgi:hypothetical protein
MEGIVNEIVNQMVAPSNEIERLKQENAQLRLYLNKFSFQCWCCKDYFKKASPYYYKQERECCKCHNDVCQYCNISCQHCLQFTVCSLCSAESMKKHFTTLCKQCEDEKEQKQNNNS